MCGIAGQVALAPNAAVDAMAVRTMTSALRHRGPDGEGMYVDPHGGAALGHRRLSVIDLATGSQPMFNEDRSIAVVFNGEIYNFQSLRRDLEARGHAFATHSDTEVIAHLYEEEGLECVRSLRGMFAFILWDARRRRLLVARDRIGKKPVYFVEAGGCLSVASEITALFTLDGLDWTLDPTAIDLYLTHSYIPSPHSILRSIRKLPPGHRLVVEGAAVRIERYWAPPRDIAAISSREAGDRLDAILREAVRLRLVADVPLGALLSGGVDSSLVVALMTELGGKVRTFSIGFEQEDHDELRYARTVARALGTEHAELMVKPDALAVLPDLAAHFGEPFGDSSAVALWYIAALARQQVTVALTGDGGDELFGGYDWYGTAARVARVAAPFPPVLRRWAGAAGARLNGRVPRRLAKAVDLLGADAATCYGLLRRTLEDRERTRLYTREFAARLDGAALRYLPDLYAASHARGLQAMSLTDLQSYLPEDVLTKVDRTSMAAGLEVRSPLLDAEVVEFAMTLPAHMKRRAGRAKILLKDRVAALFPPRFLDRPKKGFSIPIDAWLRAELRGVRDELLLSGPLPAAGIVEPASVKRMIHEHDGGRSHGATLWNLLFLAEWLRQFGGRATWDGAGAPSRRPASRALDDLAAGISGNP